MNAEDRLWMIQHLSHVIDHLGGWRPPVCPSCLIALRQILGRLRKIDAGDIPVPSTNRHDVVPRVTLRSARVGEGMSDFQNRMWQIIRHHENQAYIAGVLVTILDRLDAVEAQQRTEPTTFVIGDRVVIDGLATG
jgi:hypothetical protein